MAIREADNEDRYSEGHVDPAVKNGLIIAIGSILGFTLGFLSTWSLGGDEDWRLADLPTVVGLFVGIALMVTALYRVLTRRLQDREYDRARKYFVVGIISAFTGVFMSILAGLPWLN